MKYFNLKTSSKLFFTAILLCVGALTLSSKKMGNTIQASLAINENVNPADWQMPNFNELITYAKFDTHVTQVEGTETYSAVAVGGGRIPSGEYAGKGFKIKIQATYSGVGNGTLTSAETFVQIGTGEIFKSVVSPTLHSFCCGEGHLNRTGSNWTFSMTGQVRHTGVAAPHNHLFGASAVTTGTMTMNIRNQSGTVVTPATPPHNPDIGLISGIKAAPVTVTGATDTSPATIDSLTFTIKTGGDDLRGGRDNLNIAILFADGTSQNVANVNRNGRWTNNSSHNFSIVLDRRVTREQITRITLTTTFSGGLSGDNWNMNKLYIKAHSRGTTQVLYDRSGDPIYRFSGDRRSLNINL